MSAIKYRPEVDGLRAFAVLPVILFHLGYDWIKGGYFGVDVFFVISGFLITSILLKEKNFASFSFKKFWMRRIRRIMPALLCMVAIVLAFAYFWGFRPQLKSYGYDAFASVFSFANIVMFTKFGDYWGSAAESSPFLHCWSLSVEEQFYIIYPLIVALLISKPKRLLVVLWIITILSFGSFMWASKSFPTAGFFLLPTRAWELSAGGILAMTITKLPFQKIKNILALLGLGLMFLSYFIFTGSEGIGISAILPVLGCFLIIGYASPDNFIGKILGSKLLVFVGKISYSLYLWHWPVIVIGKIFPARLHFTYTEYIIIESVIIFALSILSFYLVEQRTRNMKSILLFVGFVFAVCVAEIFFIKYYPYKSTYDSKFDKIINYTRYYDASPRTMEDIQGKSVKFVGTISPDRDSSFAIAAFNNGIMTRKKDSFPEIVIIGDSHAAAIAGMIDEIGEELDKGISFFTMPGNNPLFEIPFNNQPVFQKGFTQKEFNTYAHNLTEKLKLWKPKVLIIPSKWTGKISSFEKVESIIKYVSQFNTQVLIVNQHPIIDVVGNDENISKYITYLGLEPNGQDQYVPIFSKEVDEANAKIKTLENLYSNIRVIDANSLFKNKGKALVIKDKSLLYYDEDHLSHQGALVIKDKLKAAIQETLNK